MRALSIYENMEPPDGSLSENQKQHTVSPVSARLEEDSLGTTFIYNSTQLHDRNSHALITMATDVLHKCA